MKFYKNNFKVKTICLLLITVIISAPLMFALPEKANAIWGLWDINVIDPAATAFFIDESFNTSLIAWNTGYIGVENTSYHLWDLTWRTAIMVLLQTLAKLVAMALIQNIVQSTINWIRSGFQGNPSFIGNPAGLLINTADQAIGEMLFRDPSLNFLCSPFQLQVKLALGLQYNDFSRKINCTLSGVADNVTNALNISLNGNTVFSGNKFINSGGWDNFIQTTSRPQNNSVGAFLIAKSELDTRIVNKQTAVTQELDWGQGALSFKSCTDTIYNANTGAQIGDSKTYLGTPFTKNPDSNSESLSADAEGNLSETQQGPLAPGQSDVGFSIDATKKTSCEVATPGAIITNQLGFQAASNQRMGEMQAALANGIDQILSALATQLLSMAITKLTKGILSGGKSDSDYKSSLNSQFQQAQQDFNNKIKNLSTSTINKIDVSKETKKYDQFAGKDYSNSFDTLDTSSMTSIASMNPKTEETADPLSVQRKNAIARIDILEKSELQFQNSMSNVKNLLTKGKDAFIITKDCNTTYNSTVSIMRASLINANVITNIDGTKNINRTLANIPWNLITAEMSASSSKANVDYLDIVRNNVSKASSSQGIIDSLTPITSIHFNTDSQASTTDYISTWLRGVGDRYTTGYCPVNLKPVFSTSMASTTAQ
jgi:hypothetical protein